jgi:hypothetical protein
MSLILFLRIGAMIDDTVYLLVASVIYYNEHTLQGHPAKNDCTTEVLLDFCTRVTFLRSVPVPNMTVHSKICQWFSHHVLSCSLSLETRVIFDRKTVLAPTTMDRDQCLSCIYCHSPFACSITFDLLSSITSCDGRNPRV